MYSTPKPEDLGTYLGAPTIDTARAAMLIELAERLCESEVPPLPDSTIMPLPDGAEAVVLAVASRAYVNPQGVSSQAVGPYQVNHPTGAPLGLTRADTRTLRRLTGQGGAFVIETCPDTAGQSLPWWDLDGWNLPGSPGMPS